MRCCLSWTVRVRSVETMACVSKGIEPAVVCVGRMHWRH